MKLSYLDPAGWARDLEKGYYDRRDKRLEKVTAEYIGDTVLEMGVVPELSGDLKRDIQRKSIPKNGVVMTNLVYSGIVNEKNITGQTDYLNVLWEQDSSKYQEMYAELLAKDMDNV